MGKHPPVLQETARSPGPPGGLDLSPHPLGPISREAQVPTFPWGRNGHRPDPLMDLPSLDPPLFQVVGQGRSLLPKPSWTQGGRVPFSCPPRTSPASTPPPAAWSPPLRVRVKASIPSCSDLRPGAPAS